VTLIPNVRCLLKTRPDRQEWPGGKTVLYRHPPLSVTLDICKQFVYNFPMIRTFASSETERFFATGKSRRLPQDILKRAAMRLTQLDGAVFLDDLRIPPSNRLEALAHDRAGQWSIRINDQWRVCFRFENGDAYEVEIVDYH
jgi:proteic killer suppression protein